MQIKRIPALLILCMSLVLSGSLLNVSPASAKASYIEGTDAAAFVFDPLTVGNISLQMSPSDYESLRWPNVSWDNEGEWRETQMSMTIGSTIYGPYKVGVHLKGAWGSWRDISGKAAFKIKMDAFVPNQTFFGLSKLTLNNMVQDASYIHEVLTYRLFRGVGVPAPRTGYANVSLNGVNYGLHLNVETVDKQMLKRWGVDSRNMFKGAVPYFPDFTWGAEPYFKLEFGQKNYTDDLTNFIAINQLEPDEWWTSIQTIVEPEQLLLEWATEIYTGHWDGYSLNRNNYFIVFDYSGKAILMPWGADQTWNDPYHYFSSPAVMFNKCMASALCYESYLQALAKVAKTAKSVNLATMGFDVRAAIRQAVATDPFGPGLWSAEANQTNAINQTSAQLQSLVAMVNPWDALLSTFTLNGKTYSAGTTVLLPPGTTQAQVSVTTNNAGARATVLPSAKFKPGLNQVLVSTVSADRQHQFTNKVKLYVLSDRASTAKISFAKNKSTITSTSSTLAKALASKFVKVSNLTIAITMKKPAGLSTTAAKKLLDYRAKVFSNVLAGVGPSPYTITKTLTSTGAEDTLNVTAKYRN